MHVVWYTAMSMDGRVAGTGDDLSFLSRINTGEDGGAEWESFVAGIDATIVGGTTLRWLFDQGHSLPLNGKPVWLLTHNEDTAQKALAAATDETPVEVRAGNIAPVVADIEASGCERLWICGGGDVAGQLLQIDRVDEVIVTIASVALGAGPALFEANGLELIDFELAECRLHGNAARLRWVRKRN